MEQNNLDAQYRRAMVSVPTMIPLPTCVVKIRMFSSSFEIKHLFPCLEIKLLHHLPASFSLSQTVSSAVLVGERNTRA